MRTKIGNIIGSFRYLECLSDTESTVNNHNPIYRAVCIHCGTERELLYRNRKPTCPVCKLAEKGRYAKEGDPPPTKLQLVLVYPNGECVVKRADDEYSLYLGLTSFEMRAQLILIDLTGRARIVTPAELGGTVGKLGGDPAVILAGFIDAHSAIDWSPPQEERPKLTPAVVAAVQRNFDDKVLDVVEDRDANRGTALADMSAKLGREVREDDFPPE